MTRKDGSMPGASAAAMSGSAAQPSLEVDLRPATERDYGFAERLYIATMRPLLRKLEAWDEAELLGRFRASFEVAQVRIIQADGRDAGFLQTSETEAEINLDQIHLHRTHRSRGIGSQLIRDLQRAAIAKKKALALAVVRGNRALELYQRLGFNVIGEDATRLYMRCDNSAEIHDSPSSGMCSRIDG
jgi:ribosomal protein S18 acetylase RimI-like enzyme